MGWKAALLAALLGLAFLASALWPVSILCFLYVGLYIRSSRAHKSSSTLSGALPSSARHLVGFTLIALFVVALLSGGTFSPVVFLVGGCLVLSWPSVERWLPARVVPVGDSILLRSAYLPFVWYALAEAKAGPELFPRAISGLEGRLIVLTQRGRVYTLVTVLALSRADAEAKVLARLRASAPRSLAGAYLLPLDAKEAESLLGLKLCPSRSLAAGLPESAAGVEGVLVLDCSAGFVLKATAYETRGSNGRATLPAGGGRLEQSPLVWEVMEAISKSTRWPEPDSFSNLLDSLVATRGAPLGERLLKLEDSGGCLVIHTLSGDEVRASRPQLRAIFSIYS